MDRKTRLEELEAQIRQVQGTQPVEKTGVMPTGHISLKGRILAEYVLNLTGAAIIGYILDSLYGAVYRGVHPGETPFPGGMAIMLAVGFLAASYRSWRILRKLDPDG